MREIVFGFRVNKDERRLINRVAARLERTESDVMRLLVREAARDLSIKAEGHVAPESQQPAQAEGERAE